MYPNLIDLGPFTLHTYGLFLALAFLIGLRVAVGYAKKDGLNPSRISDLIIYIFVAALVGAKVLHVIVEYDYYKADWGRLLSIYQVGGVYYGGLLFAIAVTVWYVRRHALSFWRTADVLIMGVAFGQILGRFGCFFAGCCWGKEAAADFPLSVTFTNQLAADQVGTPLHVPLHPTQLYEAIPMILVFSILAYSFSRRRFLGQQLFLYLLLYSVLRFIVEIFRGDPRGFLFDGLLSTSQFISIFAFLGAWVIFFTRRPHGFAPVSSATEKGVLAADKR